MVEVINAKNATLVARLKTAGIEIPAADAQILRRAEIVLREWAVNTAGFISLDGRTCAIVRRERDNKPFIHMTGPEIGFCRYAIPDREATAKRRVEKMAKKHGLVTKITLAPVTMATALEVAKAAPASTAATFISCRV